MGLLVRPEDAVTTYRYVRLALVALVVFLAASVANTRWWHAADWQTSISAYYYTSSHSVFIAALCAVGACLIVYQGRTTTEDALLNFSGVLAFVVGLVPTGRETLRGPGLPDNFDTELFAENSMWAFLVASVLTGVAVVLIARRPATPKQSTVDCPEQLHIPPWLRRLMRLDVRFMRWAERFLPWALLITLIVGAAFFIRSPSTFVQNAHGIAAFTMFGGIIAVVVHYALYAAFRPPQRRRVFMLIYAGVAVAMVATVLLAWWLHVFSGDDRPSHGIIVVEAIVIFEFALFWVIQSVDLWKVEEDKYWMGSFSELLTTLLQEPPAGADESR